MPNGPVLALDPDTFEPLQAPLERLFRAYDASTRRALLRRYPAAGEDRVADAMTHAWLAAARFINELCFADAGGWVYVVARNELFAIFERERRETAIDDIALRALIGGHHRDPAADLAMRDEAAHALSALRPRERRALVGAALGLTYQQLARATGTTYTNVNKHLTRGRARAQRLREAA